MADFHPGQLVTWQYEARGGYGYVIPVPATVVKAGENRITIEAVLKNGGTKRVTVRPEKLQADRERW